MMKNQTNTFLPLGKLSDILVQNLAQETLIYDLKKNEAFCLNQTSAMVWELANGKNTILEISSLMSKRLKQIVPEEMIWLAIDELQKKGLLEQDSQMPKIWNGITRREAVKKVGLATMIALPLIANIIAPTAITAQSNNLPPGGCNVASDCGTSTPCAVFNCIVNICGITLQPQGLCISTTQSCDGTGNAVNDPACNP